MMTYAIALLVCSRLTGGRWPASRSTLRSWGRRWGSCKTWPNGMPRIRWEQDEVMQPGLEGWEW